MRRRQFLQMSAVVSAQLAITACSGNNEKAAGKAPVKGPSNSLAYVARGGGRSFGTAVNSGMLFTGGPGKQAVLHECATVTPEWVFKWDWLARNGKRYDFRESDRIANFARANGKRIRGHTLLWHLGLPKWAAEELAQQRKWDLVEAHFDAVMGRYSDLVDQWDVVNEPINIGTRNDGLRENQFLAAFGPDYIEWALRAAHGRAPKSRNFINEFNLEYNTPDEGRRRLALLKLVERLLAKGVPLHGVGLQAHLDLRKGKIWQDGVHGLLRDLSAMGLEVAITELDVRENDIRQPTLKRDMMVADEVKRYLETVLAFSAVKSVTTWGLSDRDSWLTYQPGGHPSNRGLPYDRDWQDKPMRGAILGVLAQA
ncbi:MAG: endo-1,4-beta-xylanase [Sphingopyxis sp.]|nr:endo-1,4-beta-xylanase [Sphingopyxis sp.]